jgi:hypothetical protein
MFLDPLRPPGPACQILRKEKMAKRNKSTTLTRRSGGQPGNWNALKHGYYSKRYSPLELKDLDTVITDGLQDEIALLRVIIRRVFDYANDHEHQDLNTWSGSLNTLGTACTRLSGLLRSNQLLGGGGPEEALEKLAAAFGVAAHDIGFTDPSGN